MIANILHGLMELEVDIGIAFLIGVIVGQWIILWACWRASLKLIEVIGDIQRNKKSSSSRRKAI